MSIDTPFAIALIAAAAVFSTLVAGLHAVRWSWIVARPDEWLLRIRDGRLLRAGIGISIWRKPGDAVVRFTSAIQRVTFSASAPCREQVPFAVDGFALWTVLAEGDGPFAAFRSLGLANLAQRPPQLKSDKHLLTAPQYHAFQALLAAEVQQLVTTIPSSELLADRTELAERLLARLVKLASSLGFRIEKVEISGVRPLDVSLASDLSAREERVIREEAERVRLESGERMKHASIESESRLSTEKQLRAHALRVAEEESARALAESRRIREEADLAAALDRKRREAEAQRDAMLLVGEAQEKKSKEVRDHELATFTAEKIATAFASLPLTEARWVSVGSDTPLAGLASMIAGVKELLIAPSTPTKH